MLLAAEQVTGQPIGLPVIEGRPTTVLDLGQLALGGWPTGYQLQVLTMPVHGTLSTAGGRFVYQPAEAFWSLGSDSVTFGWGPPGQWETVFDVLLLAGMHGSEVLYDDFEAPTLSPLWWVDDPAGALRLSPTAALAGQHGLVVPAAGAGLWFPACTGAPAGCSGEGGGETGGGTVVTLRPPLGHTPHDDGSEGVVVYAAGSPGEALFELRLRSRLDGSTEMAATALDHPASQAELRRFTPWAVLPPGAVRVRLDSWLAPFGSSDGGLRLWLDDLSVASLGGLDNSQAPFVTQELGSWPTGAEVGLGFDLDEVHLHRAGEGQDAASFVVAQELFADSFEAGGVESWSVASGSSDALQVSSAGALSGALGLVSSLRGGAAGWLERSLAPATPVFNARFRLDAHPARLPPGGALEVFAASSADGVARLELWLRQGGGGMQLQLVVREDGDSRLESAWQSVPGAAHVVELQWRAASGEPVANGLARLWVDGSRVAELRGLDTDQQQLAEIAFGSLAVPAAAAGALLLDAFQSWR